MPANPQPVDTDRLIGAMNRKRRARTYAGSALDERAHDSVRDVALALACPNCVVVCTRSRSQRDSPRRREARDNPHGRRHQNRGDRQRPALRESVRRAVEWSGGTGPLALRPVCSCGGSGICEHIVASLEALRLHGDVAVEPKSHDEIDWLPAPRLERAEPRARAVWAVFSTAPDGGLTASPRLGLAAAARGDPRRSIGAGDDGIDAERRLGRVRPRAAARRIGDRNVRRPHDRKARCHARYSGWRAIRACVSTPTRRWDVIPRICPISRVDLRGLSLRAARDHSRFVPAARRCRRGADRPGGLIVLDGPPVWAATTSAIYLLDNSFDIRRVIDAARSRNGAVETADVAPAAGARSLASRLF